MERVFAERAFLAGGFFQRLATDYQQVINLNLESTQGGQMHSYCHQPRSDRGRAEFCAMPMSCQEIEMIFAKKISCFILWRVTRNFYDALKTALRVKGA